MAWRGGEGEGVNAAQKGSGVLQMHVARLAPQGRDEGSEVACRSVGARPRSGDRPLRQGSGEGGALQGDSKAKSARKERKRRIK